MNIYTAMFNYGRNFKLIMLNVFSKVKILACVIFITLLYISMIAEL
jgi:hypothetical protein